MKGLRFALLGSLVAAAAISGSATAQVIKGTATVVTGNTYGKSVWITVYDVRKDHQLDKGCVNPNSTRNWQGGTYQYLYGSFYHVRGEVKEGANCGGRTLCDTTVQINPQSRGPVTPGYDKFSGTKVSILPNGSNCYWRHDN